MILRSPFPPVSRVFAGSLSCHLVDLCPPPAKRNEPGWAKEQCSKTLWSNNILRICMQLRQHSCDMSAPLSLPEASSFSCQRSIRWAPPSPLLLPGGSTKIPCGPIKAGDWVQMWGVTCLINHVCFFAVEFVPWLISLILCEITWPLYRYIYSFVSILLFWLLMSHHFELLCSLLSQVCHVFPTSKAKPLLQPVFVSCLVLDLHFDTSPVICDGKCNTCLRLHTYIIPEVVMVRKDDSFKCTFSQLLWYYQGLTSYKSNGSFLTSSTTHNVGNVPFTLALQQLSALPLQERHWKYFLKRQNVSVSWGFV